MTTESTSGQTATSALVLAATVGDESSLPRFSVPAEVRDWGRANRVADRSPSTAVRMLLATVGWYAVCVALGEVLSTWWGWILAWVGLVACMMRIDAIHHEGVHRSLFGNRFANDVVAAITGALEGFHAPMYRCFHLTHHAVTRGTGSPSDPEDFYDEMITRPSSVGPVTVPASVMYVAGNLLGGITFAGQLVIDFFATMVGHPPEYVRSGALRRHVRRWGLVPFLIWGLPIGAAVLTGHTAELLLWWVAPMLLFLAGPYTFFALPEHYGAPRDGQMITSTGSVESNRLYRWIALDGNFHLAHHVFPNASWWWLSDADEILRDRTPLTYSGYLRFHAMVWRDMGRSKRSGHAKNP